MDKRVATIAAFVATVATSPAVFAETYQVGPDKPYSTIQETLDLLAPGDIVEVDGGETYPGDIWFRTSGTASEPITIRGIPANGARPIIEGGVGQEEWHTMIVLFYANHIVFEGFEIVGDGNPDHDGIVHKGNDNVIRDVVVHGVHGQGLLGTDDESGSLTLEGCEFYDNGSEVRHHQVYMATDESMYPGSVFRMQYCYIHDGAGGNNVKSRAERNEIYHNWLENAVYHELDLIGPDGADEGLAREDSDVVGNVFVKGSEWRVARIGGDGTGNTSGRYRFVNNTMVLGAASDTAITLQNTVESLELHNNVILRVGGTGGSVYNHTEPTGPDPQIFGSNNWIQDGFSDIPSGLTGTLSGSDPGFEDIDGFDFRLTESSPLVDAGNDSPSASGPEFPNPLLLPTHVPPARDLGTEDTRPSSGTIDIGAFEYGSGNEPGTGGPGPSQGGQTANTGGSSNENPNTGNTGNTNTGNTGNANTGNTGNTDENDASSSDDDGGCSCRVPSTPAPWSAAGWLTLLAAGLAFARRRR